MVKIFSDCFPEFFSGAIGTHTRFFFSEVYRLDPNDLVPAGLPHASPYPCRIYSLQIPARIVVISRKYARKPHTSPEGGQGPFLGDSQEKRIKVCLK
jgi:hypothetical protein